ncbi:MAG: hypothetical protein QM582_06645 [Micropruina sp.]|uniref:hypothetical protein n=1 Tax=Micropruina sp. TaxID=2737536 RepID=UPI0039E2D783
MPCDQDAADRDAAGRDAAGRVGRSGRQPLGVLAGLAVGALATWRVSRLLVSEDGPGQLVVRLRRAVDGTPLAGVMDCFACTSVWVGTGVSVALFGGRARVRDVAVLGLATSGAALLAERLLERAEGAGFLPEPDLDSPLVTVQDERR